MKQSLWNFIKVFLIWVYVSPTSLVVFFFKFCFYVGNKIPSWCPLKGLVEAGLQKMLDSHTSKGLSNVESGSFETMREKWRSDFGEIRVRKLATCTVNNNLLYNAVNLGSFKMELQKELIEKILKNDINGVKDLISQKELKADVCDEHGMTALQHASYKGNKEMVRLLLDQGGDVNSGKHEYGYTALHFAALSGNTDVCQLLLEHGAKTYATNSVGRTPSQMAAFVGNHACVTVINNFVPKSDIDYYTVPSGFETEPKLPPLVSAPLHKFVMHVNLHPVRVAINLIKWPILYENLEKIKNVLELMSHKEMRKGLETNEIMSFKFHYLSSILAEIIKCKKSLEQEKGEGASKKATAPVEILIRKMLKVNKDGFPEYQESLLKEIVKKFPNPECTIFRQMICSLSRSDSPIALSVITSTVNGQRGFGDTDVATCATCGEEKAIKKCSQCKIVQYCDRDCQKFHWFLHKNVCTSNSSDKNEDLANEKSKEGTTRIEHEALTELMSNMKTLKT